MKTQVLNVVRSKTFVFLIVAVLSTQLSMAQNLPAHSSTAGCNGPLYDGSYALGAGPTDFQPWPGSNNVRIQQASLDGTGGAVISNAGGEWLYFQAVAAWVGPDRQWHQAQGQWLASYNGFYQKVFRLQGGSWVALEPGGFDVSGHIIASQVALPGTGTYWFGANYSWGPIPGTAFQGYNSFQWVGTVRCG